MDVLYYQLPKKLYNYNESTIIKKEKKRKNNLHIVLFLYCSHVIVFLYLTGPVVMPILGMILESAVWSSIGSLYDEFIIITKIIVDLVYFYIVGIIFFEIFYMIYEVIVFKTTYLFDAESPLSWFCTRMW